MRISDPVLRKRLVFTGDQHPAILWSMMIGLVVLIVGAFMAGAHFFGDKTQTVVGETQVEAPTSSKITPPIPEAPPLKDRLQAVPSNIVSPPDVSSNVESSVKPENIPPTVQPESVAAMPPLPTAQPPEPAKPASVKGLLAKAKKQIVRKRFTSPAGDNAYDTYRQLLEKAPEQAQPVLDDILAWYFKQGQKYITRGRFTRPKKGNAYKVYQKIRDIAPQHDNIPILLNDIINGLNKQATRQLQKDRLISPSSNNAYLTYQELLTLAPNHQNTQSLLKTLVNSLLTQAKEQMDKSYYTSPKNNNAAKTYQKILTISPDNAQAMQGIKKIAKEYYQLAFKNKKVGRYISSMTWIEKGLHVDPDNADLNRLKQEVEEKMK